MSWSLTGSYLPSGASNAEQQAVDAGIINTLSASLSRTNTTTAFGSSNVTIKDGNNYAAGQVAEQLVNPYLKIPR